MFDETVSIPLFSGRITAWRQCQDGSCVAVSIPLFSGRITAPTGKNPAEDGIVSIPLFSGRITATMWRLHSPRCAPSQSLCFQGVLLRWMIPVPLPIALVSIPLFSGRITALGGRMTRGGKRVSIPLFSGRITALMKGESHAHRLCLNPFVFRAYYCVKPCASPPHIKTSQSLCFQGVLLRIHPA